MPTGARLNKSRSKEFDLVFCALETSESQQILLETIRLNPNGHDVTIDDIQIEYGNIERLSVELDHSIHKSPFSFKPQFICHVDSLKGRRKRELEVKYELPSQSISGQSSKVDLLVVDGRGRPFFISCKDSDPKKSAKLGQVSKLVNYGKAKLDGGLNGILPQNLIIPEVFEYHETALSEDQFQKSGPNDRGFAYFKHNYPKQWGQIVEEKKFEALCQIREFASAIKHDRTSLLTFIADTFAGNLKESPDFYIFIHGQLLGITKILEYLSAKKFTIEIQEHCPRKKTSVIVWIIIDDIKYCLTKIEPSFDGEKETVRETKGIIFYFQQYPANGNNYKKLFLDITE
jgi:hypothetical protein